MFFHTSCISFVLRRTSSSVSLQCLLKMLCSTVVWLLWWTLTLDGFTIGYKFLHCRLDEFYMKLYHKFFFKWAVYHYLLYKRYGTMVHKIVPVFTSQKLGNNWTSTRSVAVLSSLTALLWIECAVTYSCHTMELVPLHIHIYIICVCVCVHVYIY